MDLREEGYDALFGYEEAIGFCIGDVVPDKDGVNAAAIFAEMAYSLRRDGKTCEQQLTAISEKYGYFVRNNGYIVTSEMEKINAIFTKLQNEGRYCLCYGKGKYKVREVRDLQYDGYDSTQPDGKPQLPTGSSPMITYKFDKNINLTLRPSGTEPKVKFYCEASGSDKEAVQKMVDSFVEEVVKGEMLSA